MGSRISASPFLAHSKRVDCLLEAFQKVLVAPNSDRLRSVFGALKLHFPVEKLSLHKGLDLAIQHVVSAHQPKVFHDRLREVADHASVVGDASRIQNSRVRHLARGHVLEDDLPLLFLAELR